VAAQWPTVLERCDVPKKECDGQQAWVRGDCQGVETAGGGGRGAHDDARKPTSEVLK